MPDPIVTGRAALAEGRWRDAADAFGTAMAREATAEALYGLGAALWWLGEQRRHVELLTAAYTAFRRARDDTGAVLVALDLCCTYKSNYGDCAVAGGWLRRAERLAGDAGPLAGWIWVMAAYLAPGADGAAELATRALDAGRRGGDVDLELCALSTLGHTLVVAGQVQAGLELVDEAMAGTLARECERMETAAFTSCEMLDACDAAQDHRRATQWCRVAEDFAARFGSPYLYVRCRMLYGSVLATSGDLARAEAELRAALGSADGAGPAWRARVLARLADVRLRRGDLEEAASLVASCEGHEAAVGPHAAVAMARGEPAVAVALLQRRLAAVDERPAAPLLGLLVAALLAAGDVPAAARAADRLAVLAARRPRPEHEAAAALATGRVLLARDAPADAADELERAVRTLAAAEAPLDAAVARVELARALAPSRPEAAVAEARAALACFDRAGARADADRAAALLRTLGVSGRTGPREGGVLSGRERQVLGLVALGLSNPEIAARLHISRKTAAHHVSHVLTKLGLPNRAAAAAYASRTREWSAG